MSVTTKQLYSGSKDMLLEYFSFIHQSDDTKQIGEYYFSTGEKQTLEEMIDQGCIKCLYCNDIRNNIAVMNKTSFQLLVEE